MPIFWRIQALNVLIHDLCRFEGQVSGKNIEVGIVGPDYKFRFAILAVFQVYNFFPSQSLGNIVLGLFKRICKADAKAKTLGKTLYYTKSTK
jgi:hypothetical protein